MKKVLIIILLTFLTSCANNSDKFESIEYNSVSAIRNSELFLESFDHFDESIDYTINYYMKVNDLGDSKEYYIISDMSAPNSINTFFNGMADYEYQSDDELGIIGSQYKYILSIEQYNITISIAFHISNDNLYEVHFAIHNESESYKTSISEENIPDELIDLLDAMKTEFN